MDLFTMNMEANIKKNSPLADRMRAESLEEFVGQDHLIAKDKFLYRAIKADRISSMIFYGPPGVGKTTLAHIISKSTNMEFQKLSAVTSGVKDIRKVIELAEEFLKIYNKRTILFIDEIHRFNKSQQDGLLPHVEEGLITLIGATTENPYFEVNKALLSRVTVLQLKALEREDLLKLLNRALTDKERGLGNLNIKIEEDGLNHLIRASSGDGRAFLNGLEIAALSSDENQSGEIVLDLEAIENSVQKRLVKYDKGGDEHYDTISAFIKSIRGSDPDAALYYLAKMLLAGEDIKFIARRLIILAAEDIGNANPQALVIANSVFDAVNKIGMPEARIILAEGVIYLASSPKSNSAYLAIDRAMEDASKRQIDIPLYLRDSHYSGAEKLGHGLSYKYPHDYPNAYVKQDYLPPESKTRYYYPTDYGYEKEMKEYLERIKDIEDEFDK